MQFVGPHFPIPPTGAHETMRSLAGRVITMTLFIFTLLLYNYYTAQLTSAYSVTWILPFRNLQDVYRVGTHRVIFVEHTIPERYMQVTNSPLLCG